MEIYDVLINEFVEEIEKIREMEVGSEEHKNALEGVTKIADRIIEIDKSKEEKRDRFIKYCISIGCNTGKALVLFVLFIMSTNFERFGSFTTEGGKFSIRELLKFTMKS